MYYVIAIARDYNLVISIRAGAPGGSAAAFSTRLETCRGPIQTIDCNITIDFDWDTAGAGSGTGQVTIFSGSSGNSTVPAPGNALTYIGITNISSDCTNYNSIQACPAFSNATTTTTTTTTSTTTTTTTVAPASYSDAILKFDQYSGSYNTSTLVMPNLGTQTSINLIKNPPTLVTPSGSGVSSYLYMESFYYPDTNMWYNNFSTSNNITLYNKSFSIGFLFRTDNISNNSSFGLFSILSVSEPASSVHCFKICTPRGNFLRVNLSSVGKPFIMSPLDAVAIDPINDSNWNYVVFTFDKNAASNNVAKLYVNASLTNFDSISNASTYFSNTQHGIVIGQSELGMDFAAFSFWDNTVLTQAQVQNLYNEYNSRYTLG
jgi:hypothetical protein